MDFTLNNSMAIFVSIVLVASLFPVALGVINTNKNDICFPIPNPNFILPNAYADSWSYYFNSTNNRWYNHTSGSSVSNITYFDGFRGDYNRDFMTSMRSFDSFHTTNGVLQAELLDNRPYNITTIQMILEAGDTLNTTKTIQVGVFDSDGNVVSLFDTILPNSDLILDNSIHLYNFTGNYLTTGVLGRYIGFKVSTSGTFESGYFRSWATFYYKFNGLVYPPAPRPTGSMSMQDYQGGWTPNTDYDFSIIFNNYTSTSTDSYVLIPYPPLIDGKYPDGSTPTNSNTESGQQCADSFQLIWIVAIVSIVAIMIMYIRVIKEHR